MTDAEWISNGIGMLRQQADRSIRDVAEYCEVAPATVWKWEQGLAVPSAVSLVRLARLFGISLDYFDRETCGQ